MAIPEIYRIASSAGGMRPKAVVLYDPAEGSIRSSNASPGPKDLACILKFDGVGDGVTPDRLGAPMPFNRVEAAYSEMARAAGLETTRVEVLEHEGYAHLLIRRFDIEGRRADPPTHLRGTRPRRLQRPRGELVRGIPTDRIQARDDLRPSRAGVPTDGLQRARRQPGRSREETCPSTCAPTGSGPWRRHTTSHSPGEWTGRPEHQMRVHDKTAGIRESDLLAVARDFGVKKPERILEETRSAVAGWEGYAQKFAVPPSTVVHVRKALDERGQVAGGLRPRERPRQCARVPYTALLLRPMVDVFLDSRPLPAMRKT